MKYWVIPKQKGAGSWDDSPAPTLLIPFLGRSTFSPHYQLLPGFGPKLSLLLESCNQQGSPALISDDGDYWPRVRERSLPFCFAAPVV